MKKIYYIEITLNGYVIKKEPICDFVKDKDYLGELNFVLDGQETEFYNDIAGDYDDLDEFLKHGDNQYCNNYDNILDTKQNIYLEYWRTTSLGCYENKYVGLMVE